MMFRVTILVPDDMISAANELAACIGFTEADRYTFAGATHEDASGNAYAMASGLVFPAFADNALSQLVMPEWGADLALANDAQAAVRIWSEDDPVVADPDIIAAIISEDVDASLSLLGVTRIPQEPVDKVEFG